MNQEKNLQSLIELLFKKKIKKKLGQGAFGDVFLAQGQKGDKFAVKVINKKKVVGQNEEMLIYIKGQISCMIDMIHQNIVKLEKFEEADDYIFLMQQYCDGGDLYTELLRCDNRTFSLAQVKQIGTQIIKGLEEIHKNQYLHRDIKPQNILIKINQEGIKIFKVADFGFCKKTKQVSGTVLGTQSYMSPQIYRCGSQKDFQLYGFEVDMWAFGVTLFFMLTGEFPFKTGPRWSDQQKYHFLEEEGRRFDLKQKILKTRKRDMQKCTPQFCDLFKKMFQPNPAKRITFSLIRQHPVFAEHFPNISAESRIIYTNTYGKGKKGVQLSSIGSSIKDSYKKKPGQSYQKQKNFIQCQFQQIIFLQKVVQEFHEYQNVLGLLKYMTFSYNLLKYQLTLLIKFNRNLNPSYYNKNYKWSQNWQRFSDDNHMTLFKKKVVAPAIRLTKERLERATNDCEVYTKQLIVQAPSFVKAISIEVSQQTELQGDFFISYRSSTSKMYSTIRQILKTQKNRQYYCLLNAACLCHIYNEIIQEKELKKQILAANCSYFGQYVIVTGLIGKIMSQDGKNAVTMVKKLIDLMTNQR